MTEPQGRFCISQHNEKIDQYQVNKLVLFSWDLLSLSKLGKQRGSFRWLTKKLQDSFTSVTEVPVPQKRTKSTKWRAFY